MNLVAVCGLEASQRSFFSCGFNQIVVFQRLLFSSVFASSFNLCWGPVVPKRGIIWPSANIW